MEVKSLTLSELVQSCGRCYSANMVDWGEVQRAIRGFLPVTRGVERSV